jgi:hypothetical protein
MDTILQNPEIKYSVIAGLLVLALVLAYLAFKPTKKTSDGPLALEAGPSVTAEGAEGADAPAPASPVEEAPAKRGKKVKAAKAPKVKKPTRKERKAAEAAEMEAEYEAEMAAQNAAASMAVRQPVGTSTYELETLQSPATGPEQDEADNDGVANVTRNNDATEEVLLLDVVEVKDPFAPTGQDPTRVTPKVTPWPEPPVASDENEAGTDRAAEAPLTDFWTTDNADAAAPGPLTASDADEDKDDAEPAADTSEDVPPAVEPNFSTTVREDEELFVDRLAEQGPAKSSPIVAPPADEIEQDDVLAAPVELDAEVVTEDGRWVYRPAGYVPPAPAAASDSAEDPDWDDEDDSDSALGGLTGRAARRARRAEKLASKGERNRLRQEQEAAEKAAAELAAAEAQAADVRAAASAEKAAARAEATQSTLEAEAAVAPHADAVADIVIGQAVTAAPRFDLPEALPRRA